MLYQHNELMLKSIAGDVAQHYNAQTASARWRPPIETTSPKPSARRHDHWFVALGRRLAHLVPVVHQ